MASIEKRKKKNREWSEKQSQGKKPIQAEKMENTREKLRDAEYINRRYNIQPTDISGERTEKTERRKQRNT